MMATQYREGQRLQGSDGNVYVVQNGVPVMETAAPVGGIVTKAADPTRPYQGTKAAADAALATNKAAASVLDPRLAEEDLRGKRLANDKTEIEIKQGNSARGVTPQVRKEAIDAYRNAQVLKRLIGTVQDLDTAGPGATKGIAGLKDYLPYTTNSRLDTAGDSLRAFIKSSLGFTGGENNTARESETNFGPYIPKASDRDQVRLDKINRIIELAQNAEEKSIAVLGGIPDEAGQITPVNRDNGGLPASTLTPGGPGVATVNPGGQREFVTDTDKAFAAEAQRAFNNGAGREQLDAIAAKYGVKGGFGEDLDRAIATRRAGGRVEFSTPVSGREDLGVAGQAFGSAAASPAGVAYQNFSNAILPVGLFNPEAQDSFNAASAQEPGAALAGTIAGGVPAALGLELGAARAIPGLSSLAAGRIADAGYGAYQGAGNAPEAEGVTGGLIGGLAGLIGGEAGRRVLGGVGSAVRGVTSPAVNYLRNEGVNTTVGQTLGGLAKQTEDLMTSFPIIGGIIGDRRGEGLTGFNQAMFRQAAEGRPVQNIGERGAEELDRIVNQAYAPLDGVSVQADPQFIQDMQAAIQRGQSIPGRAEDFDYITRTRVGQNFDPNGNMTGGNFQDALQQLRRSGANQGMAAMHADDFSGALGGVEDALTGMVQRQAPEAVGALNEGNRLYRNQSIVDQAVRAARNTRGPDGDALVMPSQLNAASVQNTTRFGGANRASTTDRPFYDLATSGQEVLPSRVGDSGTAPRLLLAALASGAGLGGAGGGYGATDSGYGAAAGGAGGLAALGGLLALGGSRPAQQALVRALVDRPDVVERIGNTIYNRRALGSAFGAPAVIGGVNLLAGP